MEAIMKSKRLKKEILLITLSVLLIVGSAIYTFTPLNLDIINTIFKSYEKNNLFLSLFSVQATISVLSVSIIAIITGFQSDNVYGISIVRYITTLKPAIFKHKYLMITDLLITVANYFLVAFGLYDISISVFIISVIISCVLIVDTSFIFKSREMIYSEIGQFILSNDSLDCVDNLELYIHDNLSCENVSEVEKQLSLINEVFKNEVAKDNRSEKLLKRIEKILENSFLYSYLSTNKEMVLSILKEINNTYSISNKSTYPVDIWSSIYREYFIFIGSVSPAQLKNRQKFDYLDFKFELDKNQVFDEKNGELIPKNNIFLEYYYSLAYSYIVFNNKSKNDDYESEMYSIIRDAYSDAFYRKLDINKSVNSVKGMSYLIKELIESGENELLRKEYLRHERYLLSKKDHAFVFLVSVIYSYYLFYREPIVRGKETQKFAKLFLENLKDNQLKHWINNIDLIDVLDNYSLDIYVFMSNWEKYENMIMKRPQLEKTIQDFLLYCSIKRYLFDEECLAKCFRLISKDNVSDLSSYYFDSDNEIFDSKYRELEQNLVGRTIDDIKFSRIKNKVKNALAREYKNELITKSEEYSIDSKKISEFKSRLHSCFERCFEKYRIFSEYKSDSIQSTSYSAFLDSVDEYDFQNENVSDYINENILYYVNKSLLKVISSNIRKRNVTWESNNKQDTLIGLADGLDVNTYIGNQETFWDEKDQNKLRNYCEGFHKIKTPMDISDLYLLNSEEIYFGITDVSFEFQDFTIDDMKMLHIDVEDSVFYYSCFSNIPKAPFSKTELFDYLSKTRKKIIMSFTINYSVKTKIIGCGIIIKDEVEGEEKQNENVK